MGQGGSRGTLEDILEMVIAILVQSLDLDQFLLPLQLAFHYLMIGALRGMRSAGSRSEGVERTCHRQTRNNDAKPSCCRQYVRLAVNERIPVRALLQTARTTTMLRLERVADKNVNVDIPAVEFGKQI